MKILEGSVKVKEVDMKFLTSEKLKFFAIFYAMEH